MRTRAASILLRATFVSCLFLSGACSAGRANANASPKEEDMLRLTSSAFEQGQEIPKRYTCEGNDVSPPLAWEGAPPETQSFALVVDDPDAPDPAAPQRTWVHWIVFNLPASMTTLSEGVSRLPPDAREGLNDWKRTGYGGPCPPIGRHRYVHKLYALDVPLLLDRPTIGELEAAMQGHILARAELIGTYQKKKH